MIGTSAAILGLATALPSLANTYFQYQAQQDNLKEQKKWNTYNSWLQQALFNRDDNSILRRVADLRAAGLSPILAAGQGAGTSGPIPISGAKKDAINIGSLTAEAVSALNLMKMESEISATRAQEEYTRMQQRNAEELLPSQIELLKANTNNANSQSYKTYQDAKTSKVSGDNVEDIGFVPRTTFGGWLFDAINAGLAAGNKTNQIKKATGKPVKPDLTPKKDVPKKDVPKNHINKALDDMKNRPLYDY